MVNVNCQLDGAWNHLGSRLGTPVGVMKQGWSFRLFMRSGLHWVGIEGGSVFSVGGIIPTVGIQDCIQWRG